MSTGFRGGYINGIENLREDDGVDAGLVSDCLVNNLGVLYDAHHGHIVNIASVAGLTDVIEMPEPHTIEWRLVARWPFNMIRSADGGSAHVVYRVGFYRTGGSGDVLIGARIGRTAVDPFLADARTYQATHTTSATTPTVARGTLYVSAEAMEARHGGMVLTGPSAGSGFPARSAWVREAWFELWCLHSGTKPTVSVSSVMARQFVRL